MLWIGKVEKTMANKSLAFVKKSIASGACGELKNNHYSIMEEICFLDIARLIKLNADVVVNQNENEWKSKYYAISKNGDMIDFDMEVKYNPDAGFDYFTMADCKCDGTSLVYFYLCKEIWKTMFLENTFYIPKFPDNYKNESKKLVVKYTVGNFVFAEEHGEEFSTEDKPCMLSRFSVMLPIKCDFVEK